MHLHEMLEDQVVYRRTAAGQAALLTDITLSRFERRFLAVVTGYTSLRVLLDLGFEEPGMANAIRRLVENRFIAAVTDPER